MLDLYSLFCDFKVVRMQSWTRGAHIRLRSRTHTQQPGVQLLPPTIWSWHEEVNYCESAKVDWMGVYSPLVSTTTCPSPHPHLVHQYGWGSPTRGTLFHPSCGVTPAHCSRGWRSVKQRRPQQLPCRAPCAILFIAITRHHQPSWFSHKPFVSTPITLHVIATRYPRQRLTGHTHHVNNIH